MAKKGVQLDLESLSCSICLDLLKDPVTVLGGRSYCMKCIKSNWGREEMGRIYSYPPCMQTFTTRPVLGKNKVLADVVVEQKETNMQTAPVDHCYAGPEDVACDICTGRKLKAKKFCLQCLASYCENHIQFHFEAPPLKKHKLMEPSKKLQENVCSRHDEVMKMFCRTDQQSICYLCSVEEHKGHDTVSAAEEITERQRKLEVRRQNIQQRIQDGEVEAINGSADKTVEHSEKMFTELIRLMKKRRSDVTQQVRSQQQTEVSRVRERQEKLEQEITELKRKDAELEKLSHTQDHIQFLQNYPSVSALSESTHSSSIKIRPLRQFEDVTAAVSEVRDKLLDALAEKWTNISQTLTEVDVLPSEPEPKTKAEVLEYSCDITLDPKISQTVAEVDVLPSEPEPKTKAEVLEYSCDITLDPKISQTVAEVDVLPSEPEPKTRAEFLKYSCDITLDPNTAHTRLKLSDENRKVTFMSKHQSYSSHPDRFNEYYQILSKESLTGRCYWEVERRGTGVCLAVTYKNISRAGRADECVFGFNDKSWRFDCYVSYVFYYNNVSTPVSGPRSSRVGVYLDHRAGILSFYNISETMTLLHRVQTTFTQPLHAGLRFDWMDWCPGDSAELCKLK